ncbi:hypothetical protein MCUN1_001238 [Malassezia cuniculi]|uniref:Major facilitator superfamily (MFS) profile domain-containing protein n=1 Tax=Malassezia cuniculi TaxID=948313 RepID=A0AAF0ETI5_9BASI|nr:hypothetical protein MCUN1_001238 [Malassezia cuniculi]
MALWQKKEVKDEAPRMVEVDENHVGQTSVIDKEADADVVAHLEASAVDHVYQRKVFIVNKILNEDIGMTGWQWGLLCVCGVGWLLDNVWLQYVAMILPQILNEFDIENGKESGFMTLALFAGLTVGAATWGVLADIVGRRFSFNMTLLIAGVFGVALGGATSFTALGGLIAALGFGLGGSLPVDGMLFLEFIPGSYQYLLTLLSVFWPIGQLLVSLVGWAFIANYSVECEPPACGARYGYTSRGWLHENQGWRYLAFTMGALTLFCFFLRFAVLRIPESPKFLLAKGRDAEAVLALRKFAKLCGRPLSDDVISVAILRSAAGQESHMDGDEDVVDEPDGFIDGIKYSMKTIVQNARTVKIGGSLSHLKPLFSTFSLGYTVTVIWLLWSFIGLAYPLFNAFLPTYLRTSEDSSTYTTYRNYVIISVCGIPGSILAAALVEVPRSGRRGAMAIGTLLTGVFLFGMTGVSTSDGTLAFSCVTTFTQNIMYGVLYCYTPETFPAPYRGTGDGIGSSLNRLFGLMAPIIYIYSGTSKNEAKIPIYISAALFIVSALLMLTLRVETSKRTAL